METRKKAESNRALRPSSERTPNRAGERTPSHSAPARAPWRARALVIGSLLAVFIIAGMLSAADAGIPTVTGNNFFNATGSYAPLIGLLTMGLAAMTFSVAVIYMVAGLLRQPEWEAFLKTELYQVVVSVLLGVFLLSAAVVADGVTSRMAGGAGLFDAAQGYLSRVICVSSSITIKLEGLKVAAQYLSAMKSRYYAGAWGIVVPTFPGFEVIERALDLIQMLVMPFTSSLFVQTLILEVAHGTALTFLLPVGILLRIVPVTREAGSFLIATAFAMYFILPFTYIISAQVVDQTMYKNEFGHQMCEGSQGSGAYFLGSGAFYDSMAVQLVPSFAQDMIGTNGFTTSLSYVALQAVFLPALSMVVVVTFIKTATTFFSQKMEM